MPYTLEKRLKLVAQVSNLLLAGSINAYNGSNDNVRKEQRRRVN